ncbi:MAG: 4-hydroxybenzoate octaprenyltransferase [Pseudomonadales bacterium]|nr:4-hydroxybenzoate octaprenyltransferase [Pseudomonadales bacterium]MDG1442556.1 4-hydroxybenzoate octaprenyltransferase [Pseudomonadales bacterium]
MPWNNMLQEISSRYPKGLALVQIARLDKPIGINLLLWPTLSALWIAAEGFPGWHLLFVFVLGTVLTRSAGCVINDIADKDFDGYVERTQARPLANRRVSTKDAVIFMAALLLSALLLVLSTNAQTVWLALLAAMVGGIYPFMKRHTHLAQLVLGVAFSFGIPMAFSAVTGEVPQIAWLLALANVFWTVAYDTQYAMVDRNDDLKLGLRSTAILFGDMDKLMIGVLQFLCLFTWFMINRQIHFSWPFYLSMLIAIGLFTYHQWLIKDRDRAGCFKAFLNNHWVGAAFLVGIVAHYSLI